MIKVGIFGGSFDPPHIGHLIGAETVRKKYNLDKIIWVPAFIPPHKQAPVASPQDRANLVKLAIKNYPYFEISTLELKSKKRSYTIDTLKELIKYNPRYELFLIIGADEAIEFSKWKAHAEILKLCKIIILDRPCPVSSPAVSGSRRGGDIQYPRLPAVGQAVSSIQNAEFCPLSIDISSFQIRELVKKGKSIKKLVPQEVEEYIKEKKLYI